LPSAPDERQSSLPFIHSGPSPIPHYLTPNLK
jgi:hypothetical protein